MDVEQIMEKLKNQKELHVVAMEEVEELHDRQAEYLSSLLAEYKQVYTWYRANNFKFTHPTINIKSPFGPILGQGQDYVIVFNIKENYLEKIDLYAKDQRRFYALSELIKDGHFEEARMGIHYLENMLGEYLDEVVKYSNELREQLENKDPDNQTDSDFGHSV